LYPDADNIWNAGSKEAVGLFLREAEGVFHFFPEHVVVLWGRVLRRFITGAHFFQFFGGIEGIVGMSFADQFVGIFTI
jgi:hypothetical protein